MTAKYLLSACAAAALLAGCGKTGDSADTADAPAATDSAAMDSAPAGVAQPAASASAQLSPTQGNTAAGSLSLSADAETVRVNGTLQGLPPNAELGFHVHEKGDCSAPDAESAGAHFNPTNAQHGNPQGEPHHAGDMLNAKSDAQGTAQVETVATGVSLGTGQPNDVRGKAIVLHAKADDYASQPSGNSGARIACGVIN
jgi:superoxide dismutase, Cu-Zn family